MLISSFNRISFKKKHTLNNLSLASLFVFFFVLFDGVLMYLAPIIMKQSSLSESTIGIIIGLSSVAGMFFDVLLARLIKNTTYRTIFFLMLVVATAYPFFLIGARTITMYLVAMAVWGLYYNLYNIGILDFVGRMKQKESHVHEFGILKVFDGLGYLIAPFIGSTFFLSLVVLGMPGYLIVLLLIPSYLFYFGLLAHSHFVFSKLNTISFLSHVPKRKAFHDISVWKKVGLYLLPALSLTLIINTIDSAIWTVGPLFSESLGGMSAMKGSYLMLAYTIPPLLVGWFVGLLVSSFGKKNIAVGMLGLGSLFLSLVGFAPHPYLLLIIIFGASFCFSLSWPSINSVYADTIEKSSQDKEQVESIEDFFTNMGDVAGPIMGGFLAEYFGYTHAFFVIGFFGLISSVFIYMVSPKKLEKRVM